MTKLLPLIIIIYVVFTLILMFSKKTRNYIASHRELVLTIMYALMTIWFAYALLRPSMIQTVIKYMKKNILYSLYLVAYIAIPSYFLYQTIKSYKELKSIKGKMKNEKKK